MKTRLSLGWLFLSAVFISGCDGVGDAIELNERINQLEKEKEELISKLELANQGLERLRQENSKLKNEIVAMKEKDKKNLERLFD